MPIDPAQHLDEAPGPQREEDEEPAFAAICRCHAPYNTGPSPEAPISSVACLTVPLSQASASRLGSIGYTVLMAQRRVTKQVERLAREVSQPASWIGDQIAAGLVPDIDLPPAARRAAWAAIRSERTRGVPPDLVAVQVALHGDRGYYTRRLPEALLRLVGIDRPPVNSHELAEVAAADLFNGTTPAPGPMKATVEKVLDANASQPPMAGAMPVHDEASGEVRETLHAVATTVVGLEDLARSFSGRTGAIGTGEALRAIAALIDDMQDAALSPVDWRDFVSRMDRWIGGVPWAAVGAVLIRKAKPAVLVGAVRMAGEFPFDAYGMHFANKRDRIAAIAGMTTTTLFLPLIDPMTKDLASGQDADGIPFLRALRGVDASSFITPPDPQVPLEGSPEDA